MRQLPAGTAVVVFDEQSESCSIMASEEAAEALQKEDDRRNEYD